MLIDSAVPSVKANTFKQCTGMTDIWLWNQCPVSVSGDRDDGNVAFHFEPPDVPLNNISSISAGSISVANITIDGGLRQFS